MKIAITGGTGFIGRHVLAALQDYCSHQIVIAARTLPCTLQLKSNISVVRLDLNEDTSDAYSCLGEPDLLIHLAWEGLSDFKSTAHFEKELPKQYSFLKNMVVSGTKSIFVTGTCLEYGLLSGELHEDMPCEPTTVYGLAKDSLRQQLSYLKKEYEFKLTWARIFYIEGDSETRPSLFSSLRCNSIAGEEFFNMSQGDQLRDYLSVDTVARLIVSLALKMLDVGKVNLCSGNPVSVRSLVEARIIENGWKIKLNLGYYPYPDYESMAFWGSTKKLNRILQDEAIYTCET